MKLNFAIRLTGVLLLTIAASPVRAAPIIADENGNGFDSNGNRFQLFDPGPNGGVRYGLLPFAGTAGDVNITDNGAIQDVIRFNGDQTFTFYSDNVGGVDALADTEFRPAAGTNVVSVEEVVFEGGDGIIYQPRSGSDPGGIPNAETQPTYAFFSDPAPSDAVPEPSTVALLGIGIASMAGYGWRRRKLAVA